MTIKRLIILLVLLTISTSVHAQRFNPKKSHDGTRYRNWEAGLLLQYQTGMSQAYDNGAALDVDSSVGFGFVVGWNWTEKLNLSWRFSLNKPGYTATIIPENDVPQTIDYKLTKYSNQLNLTYNFLSGPITPYLQAGVGWTKLDSNIPSSPPSVDCWWDPWWGYICFSDWDTYKTSKFTYNLGLGLRWDINAAIFVRGSYNREFISVKNGNLDFDTVTLEGGLMW